MNIATPAYLSEDFGYQVPTTAFSSTPPQQKNISITSNPSCSDTMPITWRKKSEIACCGCRGTKLRVRLSLSSGLISDIHNVCQCDWDKDLFGQPLPCRRCTENGLKCIYSPKSTTTSPVYPAPSPATGTQLAAKQYTPGVTNDAFDGISGGRLPSLPQPHHLTDVVVDAGHTGTQNSNVALTGAK